MNTFEFLPDGDPSPFRRQVFTGLLHEAETVSEKALARLRRLQNRFPSDVPAPLLEQLERIRTDPDGERRRAVRLGGGDWVTVGTGPADGGAVTDVPVLDRSPD